MSLPLDIQVVDTWRVAENEWNPNHVPDHVMRALVVNVQRVGFVQPILVRPVPGRDTFEVVDGAHRLRAAREVGLEKVPVVVRDLTDADAKAQTLALNNLRGDMEPAEVARIVREVAEEGIDLLQLATFTGYTSDELHKLAELEGFDWGNPEPGPSNPKPADEESWTDLTFRVPESVALLVRGQVERVRALLGFEHDHLALEAIAVNSLNTADHDYAGGS